MPVLLLRGRQKNFADVGTLMLYKQATSCFEDPPGITMKFCCSKESLLMMLFCKDQLYGADSFFCC